MKKILAGTILLLLLVAVGTGCGGSRRETGEGTGEDKEYTKLGIAYPCSAALTHDQGLVEEAINEITREKLGVEIEFKVMESQYSTKINLMLAGKEPLDIISSNGSMYLEMYMKGYLHPLDGLLEQYGKGIIEEVGEETIHACDINGVLYGLPNNRDYAAGWNAYMLRKDILDKYHIDPGELKDLKDLEELYEFIQEREPDMVMVANRSGSMLSNLYFADGMYNFPSGVHMDYGRDEELTNIFESDLYYDALKRVRRWYLKGFMGDEVIQETRGIADRIQDGDLFSFQTIGKPGILQQEILGCGRELVFVQFGENAISYNSIAAYPWVITENTVSAEKSMQLLNLLYTDPDIMNLLSYGIEGKHYVKTEDGFITFPEGMNVNIFIKNAWRMPNQFITHVWEGNPKDLWEKMREFNEKSIHACDIGFNFDISQVSTEYFALKSIYEKYKVILENGLVNPREGLDEMNRELEENGIDQVIENKREQFLKWKENK